jgi:hypothetical protein
VEPVQVRNVAGLAELLHPQGPEPMPPHRPQPGQGRRVAVEDRDGRRFERQRGQESLGPGDWASIASGATAPA